MNRIKKLSILFLSLLLLTLKTYHNTYGDESFITTNDYEDFYVETIITSDTSIEEMTTVTFSNENLNRLCTPKLLLANKAANSITKTKTSKIRAKDGTLLWSVSIKATFTYDGTTSKCTGCSHSASAPAKSWTIKSVSSSKTGNSATATAVATHADNAGSRDYTRSITIKCSKDGVIS